MTTLSTGQEYNPTLIPKLKEKASTFTKNRLESARMGTSLFISETVGDVLGESIGSLAGSLFLPKDKKKKEDKQEKVKHTAGDYLKMFKSEIGSIFSKQLKAEEEKPPEKQPAMEKTNTKIADAATANNDIMLRVANATEMTEEASVEQVHVLEQISKSLASVDKKAPTKAEQEEASFEQIKKESVAPKIEQVKQPNGKSIFDSVGSILESIKSGKGIIDAVSKIGPMLSTMGSAVATITPLLGTMATILGPAALGGFLGKMYQDWAEKKDVENSKLDKKEMVEKVNATELSKLSDAGEWNKLKDTFTGKAGEKGRMQYLVEQKIENKQTFTTEEAKLVKEKIGIDVPSTLIKDSVELKAPKVEPIQSSFQTNSAKEISDNSEKLAAKQTEKAQVPIVVAPTTNNVQAPAPKQQVGQYTSLNTESTFRRLNDRLTLSSIV